MMVVLSLTQQPQRWFFDDLRPPAAALTDVPSGECLAEPTYAIYKPRNVLSAAGHDTQKRRTLTDIMLEAGVVPMAGHVGRLDFETSGLILVTAHGLLNRALINLPEVLEAYGGSPVTKRYELIVAGRHEPESPSIQRLAAPLTHRLNGRTYYSRPAVAVECRGAYVDERPSSEWRFFDSTAERARKHEQHGEIRRASKRLPSARELWHASRRAERQRAQQQQEEQQEQEEQEEQEEEQQHLHQ